MMQERVAQSVPLTSAPEARDVIFLSKATPGDDELALWLAPKHVRRSQRSGHVTVNEHMPKAHQPYANMTPAILIKMAARIGVNAATLVERMMRERPHPQQVHRSAMGIIALARRYERDRLEAACERALVINAISYSSVSAIGLP
jgi:transposase